MNHAVVALNWERERKAAYDRERSELGKKDKNLEGDRGGGCRAVLGNERKICGRIGISCGKFFFSVSLMRLGAYHYIGSSEVTIFLKVEADSLAQTDKQEGWEIV